MTLQQMAQQAIDAQNACNLSGVVRTFHEVTEAMRMEHNMSTTECNQHPICILFADKICALTGHDCDNIHATTRAYEAVERLARPTEHGVRG